MLDMEKHGHTIHFSRYNRGRSNGPISRALYGYNLICSCGFTQRVNGTQRDARGWARAHFLASRPKEG